MLLKRIEKKKDKKDKKKKKIIDVFFDEVEVEEKKKKEIKNSKPRFTRIEMAFITFIALVFGFVMGCMITIYTPLIFGFKLDDEVMEFLSSYDSVVNDYYGEINKKELVDSAISGMLNSLDDDYSYYMDDDSTDSFNISTDGSYVGVGITIQYDGEQTKIIDVLDDSPAKKAGLLIDDVLIKVNDKDVTTMDSSEIAGLISGKVGDKFNITVKRGEETKAFDLALDKIEIRSVFSDIKQSGDEFIGYINIDNFAANTAKQFKSELKRLEKEKVDSLIIDVRNNTGGHLSQVKEVLSIFFNKKTVLFQIQSKKKTTKYYGSGDNNKSYPVVILMNGGSASASEVLAACFKENYKDVKLVGVTTYGKGTVQQTKNLSDGSSFKFTTEKWLTPVGEWINEKGIEPDVVVENDPESDVDSQLEKAIELLSK